jgi:hypothetical protein
MTLNEYWFQGAERERRWRVARGMRPSYQPTMGRAGFAPELDLDGMALRSGPSTRESPAVKIIGA